MGLVAIADFVGVDEHGDPLDIVAGLTRVSTSWSTLRARPEIASLFAPEKSPQGRRAIENYRPALAARGAERRWWEALRASSRSSVVLPAGTTIVEPELLELRDKAKEPVTVDLRYVWPELCSLAREARDGLETGGFVFGPKWWNTTREVSPTRVTRAVTYRAESTATLDTWALVQDKASIRASGHDDYSGEIAQWHTHSHNEGRPSVADRNTWLNAYDFLDRRPYIGLILTAAGHDVRWWHPKPHAWVVRRDGYLRRPVWEPAEVLIA